MVLVTVSAVSWYIALEGVDGSGKSTVAAALAERFAAEKSDVLVVREPGGTPVGEAVRGLLLDSEELGVWAEVFLFAAQRAELVRTVVKPALQRGTHVISDRTYYSSIAYQGRGRGLGMREIREINEAGLDGTMPHHVFVLAIDPKSALERQENPDRIGREGVAFQTLVQDAYRQLAENDDKVRLIDADRPLDEVVDEIWGLIDRD